MLLAAVVLAKVSHVTSVAAWRLSRRALGEQSSPTVMDGDIHYYSPPEKPGSAMVWNVLAVSGIRQALRDTEDR